jgi:hypothetical protein
VGTNHRAEASRANGRNSQGPTSAEGKSRSRMNALKSGMFARATVIPSAGETQEDFDRFRADVWKQFQPRDVTTAMLVEEVVSTFWRLQRPRRCEAAEIRRRLDSAVYRKNYEDIAAADLLKARFFRYHNGRYFTPDGVSEDYLLGLDETRRELQKSSRGLEYLIGLVESIARTVESQGYLSEPDEVMLIDALGMGDRTVPNCLVVNKLLREEMRKQDAHQTEAGVEGRSRKKDDANDPVKMQKSMLLLMIKGKIQSLEAQKQITEACEERENDTDIASLVLPPIDCLERIHRAESALERRFYKALDRLLAIFESGVSKRKNLD